MKLQRRLGAAFAVQATTMVAFAATAAAPPEQVPRMPDTNFVLAVGVDSKMNEQAVANAATELQGFVMVQQAAALDVGAPVMLKAWLPTPGTLDANIGAMLGDPAPLAGITKLDVQVGFSPGKVHGGGSGGMLDPALALAAKNGGGSTWLDNGGGSSCITASGRMPEFISTT